MPLAALTDVFTEDQIIHFVSESEDVGLINLCSKSSTDNLCPYYILILLKLSNLQDYNTHTLLCKLV